MAFKKNSPGCQCCMCVDTDTEICVCSCPSRFSRIATFGDDLGTHTLSGIRTGGNESWGGLFNVITTVQRFQFGVCLPTLNSAWRINYTLEARCPGDPFFPDGAWRFNITAPLRFCDGVLEKAFASDIGIAIFSARVTAPWTCDPDAILEFDMPADLTDPVFNPGKTYPNPGGAGIVTVTFG